MECIIAVQTRGKSGMVRAHHGCQGWAFCLRYPRMVYCSRTGVSVGQEGFVSAGVSASATGGRKGCLSCALMELKGHPWPVVPAGM